MCRVLKIDYDNDYLSKLKNINITGDPNAKNSMNIHNKDSVSKKNLISKDDLNKIQNHPDFLKLMEDLKDYYQNV